MATEADVYAAFGKALLLAQSMETGMFIFYWLDKVLPVTPPGKPPRIDYSAEPLSEINMNSLGGCLRQFRREMFEEGTVDVETRSLMRKLEQAAADRNELVHSYGWKRAHLFATQQGREEMLAELDTLIASFRFGNKIVRQLVLLCLESNGLAPQHMTASEFQNYLEMSSRE